jgi:hypothetical protein
MFVMLGAAEELLVVASLTRFCRLRAPRNGKLPNHQKGECVYERWIRDAGKGEIPIAWIELISRRIIMSRERASRFDQHPLP